MKNSVKLSTINEQRALMGLPLFEHVPTVMRPGKTARQNRKNASANAAARAQANRDMKSLRHNGKGK